MDLKQETKLKVEKILSSFEPEVEISSEEEKTLFEEGEDIGQTDSEEEDE